MRRSLFKVSYHAEEFIQGKLSLRRSLLKVSYHAEEFIQGKLSKIVIISDQLTGPKCSNPLAIDPTLLKRLLFSIARYS